MSLCHAKRSVEAMLSMVVVLLSGVGLADQSAAATTTTPPPAGTNWAKIAACESSGRWHINTGNGYYGGLQISPATWRAYGGRRYARRPDLATRAQQIAVGERIVQARGLAPWPNCGYLGATGSGDGEDEADAAHRRPSGTSVTPHTSGGKARTYVVRRGDCLSVIAQRTGVRGGARKLYQLNKKRLTEGPDRIYPGQRLRLRK
ncbi:LysM peptidoglycan-binding domain-containing protein [Streptomyces halobius]|uniref:LysM peptidoglycan-binding domain-containing protein n=1 Tax=Streptomyces halobius TaxID=2879846 RepID=A0ABY4MA51_9ACTN|nr:transglycosylase family protein [Streptomyces halobius]UQA94297.1 LysM peptidoglycan-binding domain-containing protein [Streptomyces halobius]